MTLNQPCQNGKAGSSIRMSLIEHLTQVRDFRTQPVYLLWVVLVLVLMGTMSGCLGYRALADFVERHQATLLNVMGLPYKQLPSYSTLRLVLPN